MSQAPDEATTDLVSLILRSSPLSKFVLISLLVFSALSWAIVLYKWWQYGRAARHSSSFIDIFRKSAKFSEVQAVCPTLSESPLVGLFQAGYAELNLQLRQPTHGNPGEARPSAVANRP